MNKTININLGGIFFHIDELAYVKLKNYLDAIRNSLSDDPNGRDEIITDIESRIGEILSEKIKDVRQVINKNDIDEVIDIMGKPEDYMTDDDMFSDNSYSFKGSHKTKKLYRDSDDKFLGGVSSGMGYYFGIDAIWVRLAWLIAAFGFGFGFIVYIILWILLPQANTTAEKLEMEGEAVNISNIEKKIKNEFTEASERVKTGIHDVSEKVKKADYEKYKSRAKTGSQELVEVLGKVFSIVFKIIGKIIGVILLIISVSTLLFLIIGTATAGSLDFLHEGWLFKNTMMYNSSGLPIWGVSILILLVVGIPFFFLFLLGLKILSSNSKSIGKTAKLSLLGVWLVALLLAVFFGTKQAMQSAYDGSVTSSQEINLVYSDTLTIKLIDDNIISKHGNLKRRWNYDVVVDNENNEVIYSNNIGFNIFTSDSDRISVKTSKESEGESKQAAQENAETITYDFQMVEDELRLDGYFLTDVKNKFRDQTVKIDLFIPEGQIVYLEKSTKTFLDDVANTQNIYDRDMVEHYFKMTPSGLTCLDCNDDPNMRAVNDAGAFKMKIDDNGVNIEVNDVDTKERATVSINENGLTITSIKDSLVAEE